MENYAIYDEIGRGAHSFVYKARRKRSVEYVAVKSTAKARMDKILNEVQILHKLESPYVLKFYNWYESQNHIWLILEYCIGGDLLNLITQDKQLPETAIRSFGWDLVAGLQYLHSNGLVLCDLKPANILIDECGSLKLADFGLARKIPTGDTTNNKPLAPGSPNYMAPELFQPNVVHSFASDFWALGCVLFELCTGRPPFTHTNFSELVHIIRSAPASLPSGFDLSPSFAHLLTRLLDKDPFSRISWEELIAHPFWMGMPPLNDASFPQQELFESIRPSPALELVVSDQDASRASSSDDDEPRSNGISNGSSDIVASTRDHKNRGQRPHNGSRTPATQNQKLESWANHCGEKSDDDTSTTSSMSIAAVRPLSAPSGVCVGSNCQRGVTKKEKKLLSPPHTAPAAITRANEQNSATYDVSHIPRAQQRQATLKKIARLLSIPADKCVHPIAFASDIEQVDLPTVNSAQIAFGVMSADVLADSRTEDLEDHLKNVYIALKLSNMDEKANILAYLLSLSLQPKLAIVIVNSSILPLLIRMLQQTSATAPPHDSLQASILVKLRTTFVLGALFRLATFVSAASPDQLNTLMTILCDLTKYQATLDCLQLRRSSISCLGEVIFYSGTQPNAQISSDTFKVVFENLEDNDPPVRHYCMRTLVNLLCQATNPVVLKQLMSSRVVTAIVKMLVSTTDDDVAIRTTTIQVLVQLLRHLRFGAPSYMPSTSDIAALLRVLLQMPLLQVLWKGVESALVAPELAVSSLNMLNALVEYSMHQQRCDGDKDLQDNKRLLYEHIAKWSSLECILSFFKNDGVKSSHISSRINLTVIDGSGGEVCSTERYRTEDVVHPSIVRAKGLLFIYFGLSSSKTFALECIENRFLDCVNQVIASNGSALQLSSSSLPSSTNCDSSPSSTPVSSSPRCPISIDQYTLQCALHVVRASIRMALTMSAECIGVAATNEVGYSEETTVRSTIIASPFLLLDQLIQNSASRLELIAFFLANESREWRFFVRVMAKLLTSFSTELLSVRESIANDSVGDFILSLLVRFVQGASGHLTALIHSEAIDIFAHLLPAVVNQLRNALDEQKIQEDHVANCIRFLYAIVLHDDDPLDPDAALAQTEFVCSHLLPCLLKMLSVYPTLNESLWRFAVELLHGLIMRDTKLLQAFEAQDLLSLVIKLICVPIERDYNVLPASVGEIVNELIQYKKHCQPCQVRDLHQRGVGANIVEAMETSNKSHFQSLACTLNILHSIYHLLFARYEELRCDGDRAAPPENDFKVIVQSGRQLLKYCCQATVTSTESDDQQADIQEASELASRCLVYASQIFGDKLNSVLFPNDSQKRDELARWVVTGLHTLATAQTGVILRLLLTLKNCLRCEGTRIRGSSSNETSPTISRWFLEHAGVIIEIKHIAEGKSPTKKRGAAIEDQVKKVAIEILRSVESAARGAT